MMPRLAWVQVHDDLALHWTLDGSGNTATESVNRAADAITSRTENTIWIGEGRDRALRLDGYSVWIEHPTSQVNLESSPITISAWIALESYPVNEAAVVQQGREAESGFCLSIDRWGYPLLGVRLQNSWNTLTADQPLPRAQWIHLAATISASGSLALFRDASPCATTPGTSAVSSKIDDASLRIGHAGDSPVIAHTFPTGVLNGLLRDVRIYQAQLPRASILRLCREGRPAKAPDLQINAPWCAADPQRPSYHALPPGAWTNEPHGLLHWRGQYHLFYQKNANGPYWSNINWGHMTSPDLYQWTELPVALSPEHGVDSAGCWSGSVIEHNGNLAILYTGGDGHRSSICLAHSDDGIHFAKHQGNPVIAEPPTGTYPEFRDPFVWREGERFYLIIGSAVKGIGGTALLYRSDDLIHWEFRKPLLTGDRETSGVFWEMPVFIKIGDQHVLIVCEVPGRASYWVGTWKDEEFTPFTREPHRLELYNHLLSPTPYTGPQGEIITMGIIPDQRSPKECWRAGWAHLYSLPRTLSLDKHGRLQQRPSSEIYKWSAPPTSRSNVNLVDGSVEPLGRSGKCLNIRILFSRGTSRSVALLLRRSPDDRERTVLRYEWDIGRLVLDRRQSSLNPDVTRDLQETTYFPLEESVIDFEVFVDRSVIEVFVDQRAAFATRIYPTLADSDGFALGCEGGSAQAVSVRAAHINKPGAALGEGSKQENEIDLGFAQIFGCMPTNSPHWAERQLRADH